MVLSVRRVIETSMFLTEDFNDLMHNPLLLMYGVVTIFFIQL
jgi:hypothetical protein